MMADKVLGKGRNKTLLRMRTVDEMADALTASQNDVDERNQHRQSCRDRDGSFSGTRSSAEYADMLRNGWAEGVEGVEGLEGLSTDASDRITFVRGVGGAFANVPAYLSGAPDAMLMPVAAPADSVRGLTLVIDSSFHCGITPQDAKRYAQSIMKLLAWLQAEGIETAVYSVACINGADSKRMLYVSPIRQAGDVMMPERVASICHPSWLRRAWFAMCEQDYHVRQLPGTRCCSGSYGRPATATTEELQQAIPEAYSVILLPKVGSGDPEQAVREAYSLKLKLGEV